MKSRLLARALAGLTFVAGVGAPVLLATPAAWATYSQCPAIGLDTGCEILITINADGSITTTADATQGPYDGADDTLVGVQNDSASTVTHIDLSSSQPIFGFEGDGLCTASGAPAGCPFGPTGYEGPGTSFTNINDPSTAGTVVFGSGTCSDGLAAGGSAYFSLEDSVDVSLLQAHNAAAFGEATGLTIPGLADTGYVGFNSDVTLATVPPNSLVTGQLLDSRVQVTNSGASATSTATATTARARVFGPAGITIDTEDVVATSTSSGSGLCSSTTTSGDIRIGYVHIRAATPKPVDVVINEQPFAPNTTYTVGAVTVVFNEQRTVPEGLAVCAVHVYLPAGVDTCISYAETDTSGHGNVLGIDPTNTKITFHVP